MSKLPLEADDLFSGKAFAQLATVSTKGRPQVTPVWIDREGDRVLVNSARGRVKNRNMTLGAYVAVMVMDSGNPYRYLSLQGEVVEVRTDGADAQLDRLAQRYLGQATYPWRHPGEVRELFVIEPTKVQLRNVGGPGAGSVTRGTDSAKR